MCGRRKRGWWTDPVLLSVDEPAIRTRLAVRPDLRRSSSRSALGAVQTGSSILTRPVLREVPRRKGSHRRNACRRRPRRRASRRRAGAPGRAQGRALCATPRRRRSLAERVSRAASSRRNRLAGEGKASYDKRSPPRRSDPRNLRPVASVHRFLTPRIVRGTARGGSRAETPGGRTEEREKVGLQCRRRAARAARKPDEGTGTTLCSDWSTRSGDMMICGTISQRRARQSKGKTDRRASSKVPS